VTFERGFRRILVVLCLLAFGAGITVDAMFMKPHATVRVTLGNGHQYTVERHAPNADLLDHDPFSASYREMSGQTKGRRGRDSSSYYRMPTLLTRGLFADQNFDGGRTAYFTRAALALVVFIWAMFYSVQWIVHGFVKRDGD